MNGRIEVSHSGTAVLFCLLITLSARTTMGQEPAVSTPPDQELVLGADVQSMLYSDYVCQTEPDAVLCVSPFHVLGFEIDAFYLRPMNRFAIGLTGGVNWLLGGSQTASNDSSGVYTTSDSSFYLFRVALAMRVYILSLTRLDLWTSFETGFVGGTQTYTAYEDGLETNHQTYTKLATELGLTGGLDLQIAAGLHIGIQLGALLLLFNDDDYQTYQGGMHLYTLGNGIWFQFGTNISYHFGL